MLKKDPLSERLLEVLTSALRRLEDALGEQKWRAAPSTLREKLPSPQQGAVVRVAGVFPPGPMATPDGRTTLKPRTFSVTLPFSLVPSSSSRAENPITGVSSNTPGASGA